MTATFLLQHYDHATLWPAPLSKSPDYSLARAYQDALALRSMRLARGEHARGFKLGFTNRSIWPIYDVYAPIWGTVYDSTLHMGGAEQPLALDRLCQPRIEPEIVFGIRHTPAKNPSLQDVFEAIEWLAPGFELVQTHLPDWKFQAPDTVADGALHGRLVIGARVEIGQVARDGLSLHNRLAGAGVQLYCDDTLVQVGSGHLVLDSPLQALQHFLQDLRACPGAPDLLPGDVVTTGTWTDAFEVKVGQNWRAEFDAPIASVYVRLS